MSEKIDELIKDIAIKHGITVGRDDPVLILHSINDKLMEENQKAQQEILAQFKQEMEGISSAWRNDAKDKAEKVLNVALTSSKELMAKMMQEGFKESLEFLQSSINSSISEARLIEARSRRYSILSIVASGIIFVIAAIMLALSLG